MNSDERQQILSELRELRKQVQSTRRWAIFNGICLIILLTPVVLVFLAPVLKEHPALAQFAGVILLFLIAAAILGQFAPAKPDSDS